MSAPGHAATDRAPRRRLDPAQRTGLWLLAGAAAWTALSASVAGSDAVPRLALHGAVGGALLAGWFGARVHSALVPAAVAAVALTLPLWSPSPVIQDAALGGPFGYANATASFYMLAAVAALMLAVTLPGLGARIAAALAAAGFAIVPFLVRSASGAILIGVLIVAAVALPQRGGSRPAVIACGAALGLALVVTAVLGAASGGRAVDTIAGAGLTQRRVALWHDALVLLGDHPATGVGPGRFADESPVARSDPDARHAHNGFLQQGAEEGVAGMALLCGLFLWGFALLSGRAGAGLLVPLGAVALATAGIHACIDYVFHIPAIPVTAAALLGAASASATGSAPPPTIQPATTDD